MAITVRTGCGYTDEQYTYDEECNDESALIIGAALMKRGYDPTLLDDTEMTWQTAVDAGDVIIIPELSGSVPEPTPVEVPGKGKSQPLIVSHSYDIPVEHYGVDANLDFWAAFGGNDWGIAVCFEDNKVHVWVDKDGGVIPATFFTRPTANGEVGSLRTMMVNARFNAKGKNRLPYAIDAAAGIFENGLAISTP